jgi:hypothetical protein
VKRSDKKIPPDYVASGGVHPMGFTSLIVAG